MKSKLLKRSALLLGIAVLGFVLLSGWTAPTHRIIKASFDRISEGMTRLEVEALLRSPPGKYCSTKATIAIPRPDGSMDDVPVRSVFTADDDPRSMMWVSDAGLIVIIFDDEERVVERIFYDVEVEGFMARAKKWIAKLL